MYQWFKNHLKVDAYVFDSLFVYIAVVTKNNHLFAYIDFIGFLFFLNLDMHK
jgi:hypothetical protein